MTRLSGLRRPVLGTVTAAGKVAGEVVPVPMTATHRRVRRRLRAPDGVELLLALPTGTVLTPGSLLEVRGGVSYVVGAAPEDVAVIRPSDMPEAAALGHAVGNLHRDLLCTCSTPRTPAPSS
ncbi:urease accessory protein UreE [Deinococcus sp. PEB2-63]